MTNKEIQKHIEDNCRDEHGSKIMDEQAFYEGAKWCREMIEATEQPEEKKECKTCKHVRDWSDNRPCFDCGSENNKYEPK